MQSNKKSRIGELNKVYRVLILKFMELTRINLSQNLSTVRTKMIIYHVNLGVNCKDYKADSIETIQPALWDVTIKV